MIISEGLNDDVYMEEPNWVNQEQECAQVKVDYVQEKTQDSLVIQYTVTNGPQKGCSHKAYYSLQGPSNTPMGGYNKGMLWKFRNVMIACGFYETDSQGKKRVTQPFDPNELAGKELMVDFVKREKDGKTYINLQKEREIPKEETPF